MKIRSLNLGCSNPPNAEVEHTLAEQDNQKKQELGYE